MRGIIQSVKTRAAAITCRARPAVVVWVQCSTGGTSAFSPAQTRSGRRLGSATAVVRCGKTRLIAPVGQTANCAASPAPYERPGGQEDRRTKAKKNRSGRARKLRRSRTAAACILGGSCARSSSRVFGMQAGRLKAQRPSPAGHRRDSSTRADTLISGALRPRRLQGMVGVRGRCEAPARRRGSSQHEACIARPDQRDHHVDSSVRTAEKLGSRKRTSARWGTVAFGAEQRRG